MRACDRELPFTSMISPKGWLGNPSVLAKEGLDQLYKCDRANRKQYYDLLPLEPLQVSGGDENPASTVLQSIIQYSQHELIMHPVCRKLIEVKWEKFGRWGAIKQLLFELFFVIIWTVPAVSLDTAFDFSFKKDAWRIAFLMLGVVLTFYEIKLELMEIRDSNDAFIAWRDWREQEIKKDFKYCHPQWQQEKQYLVLEIDKMKAQAPKYFSDKWNLFDWGVYISLLVITLLHVVDIFVVADGLSLATQNIFAIVIIFVWVRLMKSMRAFTFIGPFIVMLAEITKDFVIFLYLYANFFIPYVCAFWMVYGGKIPGLSTVDQMVISLFRITLIDDYKYEEMRGVNVWMTYILLVSFLMISALLCINVLIALLSNTFQRVYDNATAIALMQQTKIILNIEDGISKKMKKKYYMHMKTKCNPLELKYDDDMTTEGGDAVKLMTFQIRDSLSELNEFVREEQHKSHGSSITDVQTKIGELTETHRKELGKIRTDILLIHELLKTDKSMPGRLPLLDPPSPTTLDPTKDGKEARRRVHRQESRRDRKKRQQQEEVNRTPRVIGHEVRRADVDVEAKRVTRAGQPVRSPARSGVSSGFAGLGPGPG